MFSVAKTKLHGMQDKRWITKDKLTQYRGLIMLHKRDRKIMESHKAVRARRIVNQLKALQKSNNLDRIALDNAIRGDRNRIRNALSGARVMQLAYHQLQGDNIVDHIYQDNFNQRKVCDRIGYRLRMKTEQLIAEKLQVAEWQDRIMYMDFSKSQVEIDAGIITGKVQDALLKKEAAITVQHTYNNIINIMRKDTIYHNEIIKSLEKNTYTQAVCLLQTIHMGQLATEYLDDRKYDYKTLERTVRDSMKERADDINVIRALVKELRRSVKGLIRRESDTSLYCDVGTDLTASMNDLKADIAGVTGLLEQVRKSMLVSSYDCLIPCMEQQQYNLEKLNYLLEGNMESRDRLQNKHNHAVLVLENLRNSMVDTTEEYKQQRDSLKSEIATQRDRKKTLQAIIQDRCDMIAHIKRSIAHLVALTQFLDNKKKPKLDDQFADFRYQDESAPAMIEIITNRLKLALSLKRIQLDEKSAQVVEKRFQKVMNIGIEVNSEKSPIMEDEMLEDIVFEDLYVPTRESIKNASKDIVATVMKLAELEANTEFELDKKNWKKKFKR